MRSVRLLLFALLADGCGFLMLIPNQRVNAVHHWNEYKLWATYWSIQEGFSSTLELKNNRIEDTLQVSVSLYGMAGQEQYLQPITIAPRQTIVVDLNSVLSSLPRNLRARLGQRARSRSNSKGPTPLH